jgi:hypothetical protein
MVIVTEDGEGSYSDTWGIASAELHPMVRKKR